MGVPAFAGDSRARLSLPHNWVPVSIIDRHAGKRPEIV